MKKGNKTAEEYAADESFQNFCYGRSKKDVRKWERIIRQQPQIKEQVEEAKFMVMLFTPQNLKESTPKKSSFLGKAIKIAAFFVVLIACGFIVNGKLQKDYKEITKYAENGNIEIHLSDLTTVNLREGSSLRFVESWENSKEREVFLDGEAFFDVTKSKPFLVHLANGTVKVLGTKFLVKSDSISTRVILEEGLVNFLAESKVFEMSPGDHLSYNENEVSIQSDKEMSTFDSWRKSSLAFKNLPLKEVINTINNSYDLTVELGNKKLENRKITTTINQNDPRLLLSAIAEIYDIKMIEIDHKIILK